MSLSAKHKMHNKKMLSKLKRLLIGSVIVPVLLLGVAACSPQGSADTPVGVVENYLKVRVASDSQKLVGLSCKAWEGKAMIEADSFRSRDAKLEGASCKSAGEDGGFSLVACEGKILANYQGETRAVNLADRKFKTIQEDGRWKMCGYL